MIGQQNDKNYEVLWNRLDSLQGKGLNRSAFDLSVQIFNKAKADRNSPELVKAMIHRLKFQDYTQEDALVKNILSLEAEAKIAAFPEQLIFHSMLAEIYWGYYQSNRYRFINRSETTGPKDDDLRTWDLRKIIQTCLQHYSSSLTRSEESKLIPVKIFDPVIIKGSPEESRRFRPTLYDFLAHRALDFYMNSETGLTEPAESFQLDNPVYLGNAEDFLKIKLSSSDTSNLKYKSIALFQNLLSFHSSDTDPAAIIDADLKRLNFIHTQTPLIEKDSLYEGALMHLAQKYNTQPGSAEAYYQLAIHFEQKGNSYQPDISEKNKWDLVKADQFCDSALLHKPDSACAAAARNLKSRLRSPALSFTKSNVNPMGKVFRARLEYRNLSKLFFRVVADSTINYLQEERYGELLIRRLQREQVFKSWSIDLPEDKDLHSHSIEMAVPSLDFGKYILLVSDDQEFSYEKNVIAYGSFRISDMSLLSRRLNNGGYEFYVLDRSSGVPVSKVSVEVTTKNYDAASRTFISKITGNYLSDDEGRFVVASSDEQHRNFNVELIHGKDRLFLDEGFYQYTFRERNPAKQLRTVFFTDRSIYRPGQMIYFKALILDVTDGVPKILSNQKTDIKFFDVNGQLISELKLQSNEYGTVQGVFTVPQGILNGMMRLQNESGSRTVSVEEYKRPRFECNFNPVKGAYRVGEKVEITGNAKTYSGLPVDGARVTYRITRLANFPDWCFWYRGIFPQKPAQEILNGTSVTDSEGNFSISFMALPDISIPEETNPVFSYELKADITDINGEARSTSTILKAAYVALELSTDFPSAFDLDGKAEYKIVAKNLSGIPEPVNAAVQIFRIKEPARMLRSREWARADKRIYTEDEYISKFPLDVYDREDEFLRWEKEKLVWSSEMKTGSDSLIHFTGQSAEPGFYLIEVATRDIFGQEVKLLHYFTAYRTVSVQPARNSVYWLHIIKDDAQPGGEDQILISSAAKNVRVLFETEVRNKIVSKQWLRLNNEQRLIKIPVLEEYRGNFSVHLTVIKDDRVYSEALLLKVPWETKELNVEYETFRSIIEPGKKEEWKIRLKDKQGGKVAAEMLLSMYDASLDAFRPHTWKTEFYSWYYTSLIFNKHTFGLSFSDYLSGRQPVYEEFVTRSYDALNWFGYEFGSYSVVHEGMEMLSMQVDGAQVKGKGQADVMEMSNAARGIEAPPSSTEVSVSGENIKQEVQIRKNLQETAFFFPELKAEEDGSFVVSFTSPEALTRWKMQLFAHTKDLKYVFSEKEIVTKKELMVIPNLPRFLRTGDSISISAKINSLSDGFQSGNAVLNLFDAFTMLSIDSLFSNTRLEQQFSVSNVKSENVSWKIQVPENVSAVVVRINAKAGNYSDGEEQILPVLTNRRLMTETMPFWTKGNQAKDFEMKKLVQNSSSTLQHHRLTLEYTANPIWTVVQALPYMMEYPYDCSEQIFSRYYANSIASFISNSSPKIQAVFKNWKSVSPESFLSNLEKNQDLKSIVLEESPWVLDARDEKERKERVGLLFDLNRMSNEQNAALVKLEKAQDAGGAWSWFKGMPEDRYITQHIISGLAHLHQLDILSENQETRSSQMIQKALSYLDNMIADDYRKLVESKSDLSKYKPSPIQIQYLYLRSFDVTRRVENQSKKEYEYFLNQAAKFWLNDSEYMQAMTALALFRNGKIVASKDIMNSLKENAQRSEELGMYWKNNTGGYFWTQAAVETQSILIEAFHEIEKNRDLVEEMKLWLLRQKQTHNWKSTKATADACYALLLQGNSWTDEETALQINVGTKSIKTNQPGLNQEAGTGTFKISWNVNEIEEGMGKVQVLPMEGSAVKNDSAGVKGNVSWGALYWQYFEDIDKVSATETGAIILKKNLFVQRAGAAGPVIEKIENQTLLHTGDRIVARIELRTDRDMEYVHLKDLRAAGLEPENVISAYKWQDGLGYYESTKDASTDFFISFLPKGSYIFEYSLRASQQGNFSTGPATIQNMYAPEFSAHSFGGRIQIISP